MYRLLVDGGGNFLTTKKIGLIISQHFCIFASHGKTSRVLVN